jgi:hypothetical protein
LQDTHAIGVSENLLRLLVIAVSDVAQTEEKFEWILRVDLSYAPFDFFLDFGFPLFPM